MCFCDESLRLCDCEFMLKCEFRLVYLELNFILFTWNWISFGFGGRKVWLGPDFYDYECVCAMCVDVD